MDTITINKTDHFEGNPTATIKVFVYEDYECEFCGKAFGHLRNVRDYFKEKICLIYRNFPFMQMHPYAIKAALTVEACANQYKFLQARDLIFEYQDYLEYGLGAILQLLRKKHSISLAKLNEDIEKEELKQKIRNDIETGKRYGVKNTPAVFIDDCRYEGMIECNSIIELTEKLFFLKKLSKQKQLVCILDKIAMMHEY